MATITFNTPVTAYTGSDSLNPIGCALDGATVILAYNDPLDVITLKLYTIAGTTPTLADTYTEARTNDLIGLASIRRLSATRFIVSYREIAGGGLGFYVAAYQITGGVIAKIGTERLLFVSGGTPYYGPLFAVLSETRFIAAWTNGTTSPDASHTVEGVVCNLSGKTITAGATVIIDTGDFFLDGIAETDATTAGIIYRPDGAANAYIRSLYNISSSTFTVSAATTITGTNITHYSPIYKELGRLIAFQAITSSNDINLQAFAISGATITAGTRVSFDTNDEAGLIAYAGPQGLILRANEGITFNSAAGTSVITDNADDTAGPAGTYKALSYLANDDYIFIYTTATPDLRIAVITTSPAAPAVAEVRALSISAGTAALTFFYNTIWRAGTLYLQKRYLASAALVSETSLGTATMADVNAYTYIAYCKALDDNTVYVYGNMSAPAGLAAGDYAIIKTTNGATSFSSITSGWGGDYCAALTITNAGTMHAIRQSSSTFVNMYQGDTLAIVPNPPALENITNGAFFAAHDLQLLAADSAANGDIFTLTPNYTAPQTITGTHPVTAGVARIIKV